MFVCMIVAKYRKAMNGLRALIFHVHPINLEGCLGHDLSQLLRWSNNLDRIFQRYEGADTGDILDAGIFHPPEGSSAVIALVRQQNPQLATDIQDVCSWCHARNDYLAIYQAWDQARESHSRDNVSTTGHLAASASPSFIHRGATVSPAASSSSFPASSSIPAGSQSRLQRSIGTVTYEGGIAVEVDSSAFSLNLTIRRPGHGEPAWADYGDIMRQFTAHLSELFAAASTAPHSDDETTPARSDPAV